MVFEASIREMLMLFGPTGASDVYIGYWVVFEASMRVMLMLFGPTGASDV